MKQRFISVILLLAIALMGCGAAQPLEAEQELEPMESQAPKPTSGVVEVSPLPTFTPAPGSQSALALSDSTLKTLVAKSVDDLAQRLSIPADQIKLQEVIEVSWADSSLGCVNQTSQYLQVITPGYLLRFLAMDRVFEYHTDKTNIVLYCENPSVAPPGTLPEK